MTNSRVIRRKTVPRVSVLVGPRADGSLALRSRGLVVVIVVVVMLAVEE